MKFPYKKKAYKGRLKGNHWRFRKLRSELVFQTLSCMLDFNDYVGCVAVHCGGSDSCARLGGGGRGSRGYSGREANGFEWIGEDIIEPEELGRADSGCHDLIWDHCLRTRKTSID